jgi:hypothetical protein
VRRYGLTPDRPAHLGMVRYWQLAVSHLQHYKIHTYVRLHGKDPSKMDSRRRPATQGSSQGLQRQELNHPILLHISDCQLTGVSGTIDWVVIARDLENWSNKDCRNRWMKINSQWCRGAWTDEEDKQLAEAVNAYGFRYVPIHLVLVVFVVDPLIYLHLAGPLYPRRLAVAVQIVCISCSTYIREAEFNFGSLECAKRWQNSLDPDIIHGGWTAEEVLRSPPICLGTAMLTRYCRMKLSCLLSRCTVGIGKKSGRCTSPKGRVLISVIGPNPLLCFVWSRAE